MATFLAINFYYSSADTTITSVNITTPPDGGGGPYHTQTYHNNFDLTPPLIFDIDIIYIGSNHFRVAWKTNEPVLSGIDLVNELNTSHFFAGENPQEKHYLIIKDLKQDHQYRFQIFATDGANNTNKSSWIVVSTLATSEAVTPSAPVVINEPDRALDTTPQPQIDTHEQPSQLLDNIPTILDQQTNRKYTWIENPVILDDLQGINFPIMLVQLINIALIVIIAVINPFLITLILPFLFL